METPASGTLRRLLGRLRERLGANSVTLVENDQELVTIGEPAGPGQALPFSSYYIRFTGPRVVTQEHTRSIKQVRKMFDILVRGIQSKDGRQGISADFLIDSYLEILELLEDRSDLLLYYEKILQLNERILMAEDLFTVLQIIMDTACDATNGEASSLLLVDQKTGEMYFNVVSGDSKTELKEIRIPAGEGIAGSVVQNARAEIVRDVASDARTFQRVDKLLQSKTRDMIVAPIVARAKVIGVIEVINSTNAHGFLSEDLELLSNIASHTSLFIENLKSKEDLIRSNQRLDRKNAEVNALHEIGRVLNSTLDPIELRRLLLRTLLRVVQIRRGAILEPGVDAHTLRVAMGAAYASDRIQEESISSPVEFKEVGDVLLWMTQYSEPFYFVSSGQSENKPHGLAARVRQANAEHFEGEDTPEMWVPIFDQDGQRILFVISLGGLDAERDTGSDLTFFRGVMNQCYTAFRNVASYREALEAREREQEIRRAFQKYVPARVVADLLEHENPAPTEQTVTILFADIRNFSLFAERLSPPVVGDLLNMFFEQMVGVVNRHDGIVDKFMGDSLMALFGVPDVGDHDASRALACANDMLIALGALNEERGTSAEDAIRMGIGVHTGNAIVGNFGSRQRLDFTVIGDTVNLAARLEKASKYYQAPILYTAETCKAAGAESTSREIDLVQVRGREGETRLFQPFRFSEHGLDETEGRTAWQEALALYREGRFAEAGAKFQVIAGQMQGEDRILALYRERSEELSMNPPGADWKPVFRVDG